MPTAAERKLHDLTHCVYGQAADDPHRTVVGEAGESTVPRVMMDYCYFKESVRSETWCAR